MCLSTVYTLHHEEKNLACKNIATVTEKDGKFYFTDIMGATVVLSGTIEKIDLMDNYIYLRRE